MIFLNAETAIQLVDIAMEFIDGLVKASVKLRKK